jgi:hypothetical protein
VLMTVKLVLATLVSHFHAEGVSQLHTCHMSNVICGACKEGYGSSFLRLVFCVDVSNN